MHTTISFHSVNTEYQPPNPNNLKQWINTVVCDEKKSLKEINFIFCNDDYLLEINQKFLNHSNYTDVITFDYSENEKEIQGEIYVSEERVRENAEKYEESEKSEMFRVMIHGVLHLLGYDDKTEAACNIMKEKEECALRRYKSMFHVEHL